jgi:hypothetical protein
LQAHQCEIEIMLHMNDDGLMEYVKLYMYVHAHEWRVATPHDTFSFTERREF